MKKPKIAILLAAYNGVEFLDEQFRSILNQQNVDVSIIVSIDLSTDKTKSLVDKYVDLDKRITVLPYGQRFGIAAKNFYRLISDINFCNYDYIALSDQDDIWDVNKLSHAVHILNINRADIYSSDVIAFWDDNNKKLIKKSYKQKKFDHFFESPGAGCTFLARSANMQTFQGFILNNWEEVSKIESHDWLMYAFYRERDIKWIIDDKPLMLYRQHGLNQVGANIGFKEYVKRIKSIRNGLYRAEIYKIFTLVACKNKFLFDLDWLFLLKNVYQLRRRNRDVLLILVVIIFRIF